VTRTDTLQNGQIKRQINVGVDKNTLRIQFSRQISQELFGQKQKYLYLQLSNTPENLIEAERIAREIENDIRAKKLHKDLKVYLPVNRLRQSVGLYYDPNRFHISLIDLFSRYCEFIKPQLQETTYIYLYQRQYKPILTKAHQDLNLQIELVDYLFKSYPGAMFLDLCSLLSRMIDWGKKRGLIHEEAPSKFSSLKNDYQVVLGRYEPGRLITNSIKNYKQDRDYRAFTRQEAKIVIQAFEDYAKVEMIHCRSSKPYSLSENIIQTRCTARDYVKLKFWTGCRSGEASALRWLDIGNDFEYIYFNKNYHSGLGKLKSLKTEHVGEEGREARKFPCGEKLKLLLEDLYRRNYRGNPEDFLFVSLSRKPVNICYISYHWYGTNNEKNLIGNKRERRTRLGVVTQLVVDNKISQYLTPYATRHTWITLQLLDGVHINNVAKLAGNSPKTILKHYSSFVPNLPLASEI
jgi:integrase